jgi:hypothetical protein
MSNTIYDRFPESFTCNICSNIYHNKYFTHDLYDPVGVTFLKNLASKTSCVALIFLAPIEWISRLGLSISAYTLSIISSPIEWTVKLPFSLLFYRDLPSSSISSKIYNFAYHLCFNNYHSLDALGWSIGILLDPAYLTKNLALPD